MKSMQRDEQRQSDTEDNEWNEKVAVGEDGAKFFGKAHGVLIMKSFDAHRAGGESNCTADLLTCYAAKRR
jgi:hypothetical protein